MKYKIQEDRKNGIRGQSLRWSVFYLYRRWPTERWVFDESFGSFEDAEKYIKNIERVRREERHYDV